MNSTWSVALDVGIFIAGVLTLRALFVVLFCGGFTNTNPLFKYSPRYRASEWIDWPLYTSQLIAPLFCTQINPLIVVLIAVVLDIAWLPIYRQFVSYALSFYSASLVENFKWPVCLWCALYCWNQGAVLSGFAALCWPAVMLVLLLITKFIPRDGMRTVDAFTEKADDFFAQDIGWQVIREHFGSQK